MEQLKPCPFCGGEVTIETEIQVRNFADGFFVSCRNGDCDVQPQTILMDTEEEAIEAWNRRMNDGTT